VTGVPSAFIFAAGTTIPLRTEVTRADFSPESLDQHIATGALIPIA
jgi:hypothetical protein